VSDCVRVYVCTCVRMCTRVCMGGYVYACFVCVLVVYHYYVMYCVVIVVLRCCHHSCDGLYMLLLVSLSL